MQKFLWSRKLPCNLLPRVTEIVTSHLRADEENGEICLDSGAPNMF